MPRTAALEIQDSTRRTTMTASIRFDLTGFDDDTAQAGVSADELATTRGLKAQLLIWALRNGGKLLEAMLRLVNATAAGFIRRYAHRIADYLEGLTGWGEATIADGLRRMGIPDPHASRIAWVIMTLVF
jgi:hypothetical protein